MGVHLWLKSDKWTSLSELLFIRELLSTTYWNPCHYFNVSVWTNLCLFSFQHLSVLKFLLPNNDNNWGFTWWEWVILSIYLYDTLSHYYFCIFFLWTLFSSMLAKSILREWNFLYYCIRKWLKYGKFFKQCRKENAFRLIKKKKKFDKEICWD